MKQRKDKAAVALVGKPMMLPAVSHQIWKAKYRFQRDGHSAEQSIEETWARVAKAAASAEHGASRKAWEQCFLEALAGFAFVPAGRILAGAGTGREVTLFNCFVMGEIADNMSSIFENVREAALTLQQGGGIGHDFSTLRPKGALVRGVGADASGPVSFMEVWDAMCKTIMSAGARRGAMMGTLRCDHPDIERFVEAKSDPSKLRNFNVSVLVTDGFMEAVRADAPWPLRFGGETVRTIEARALWEKIMRSAFDYAEPGVVFIDRVNALNNLSYCETINATNPCVTGDTWVQTSQGPRQVRNLVGLSFAARVNGTDHVSLNGFFCTGVKPTIHLKTVEGYSLKLTANHLVRRVTKKTRSVLSTEWCAAADLSISDTLILNNHGANTDWEGPHSHEEGYLIGLLVGDGTLKQDTAVLSVWIDPTSSAGARGIMTAALESASRLESRSDFRGWTSVKGRAEFRLSLAAVRMLAESLGLASGSKTVTPNIEATSSAFHKGFLKGFFDCGGSVQESRPGGVSVRLARSNLECLQAAQRMLLRLGIASRIYSHRRRAGMRPIPEGRRSAVIYFRRENHELVISGENLLRFRDRVGFCDTTRAARLEKALSSFKRKLNRERFTAKIQSMSLGEPQPVYDVQVAGVNAFDANGFYVHNCGEQPLPPYGACLLGSINLAALVEEPFTPKARLNEREVEKVVPVAVRFLDNIIDVSRYPLAAQEREAKAKRRIGLGVTGLADALILCGHHYGSTEARALAERWMELIGRTAYQASADLAAEKGAFPLFDRDRFLSRPFPSSLPTDLREAIAEHGVRNGMLTSIAPTGTISLLAGNVSSGIEPVFDFQYRRRILEADGSARHEVVEDYAHRLFREAHPAAPLPACFVTAHELSPREHLLMQAAAQKHIDASISKTVNCPSDMDFNDFESLYIEAYRLGLKGCTAYRPNPVTGEVLSRVAAAPAPVSQPSLSLTAPPPPAPPISAPTPREAVLSGFTYKLKWPGSDHAIYVTINDTVEQGRRRPFEIFINSKNLEHYAWTVALTRMISAIFRRGGDVAFVVEELKAVFDPRGGAWMDGKYVPSLLAAIGDIIERHFAHIGFGPPAGAGAALPRLPEAREPAEASRPPPAPSQYCPRCGSPDLIFQEGCRVCRNCGHSSCG